MRRHGRLVVVVVAAFAALGVLYVSTSPEEYEATAEIIVQDPRAPTTLNVATPADPTNISSERYLADQVEILESAEVANRASDLMGGDPNPGFILTHRSVEGSATSNLIQVNFLADDPTTAKATADSLVDAYLEVRRDQIRASANAALARVDALREALDEEIASLNRRIEEGSGAVEAREQMRSQVDEAFDRFNDLRRERDAAPAGSEERALLNAEIDELVRDFEGWEVAVRVQQQDPTLAPLLAEQQAAIDERAALTARRNSIAVDAEVAAEGITLISPAPRPTQPAGLPPELAVGGLAALGLAIASVLSYFLTLRRRLIISRSVPEAILAAPLLAEIPAFDLEGLSTHVPVASAPTSASAEAFRFAAAAIDIRASAMGARSLLVCSPGPGAGTTTTVVNIGITAAHIGSRIVVIDGDFESQQLSSLLGLEARPGITEVLDGTVELDDAIHLVSVEDRHGLAVLRRGRRTVDPTDFLRHESTLALFRHLRESYDLVLIDGPPLLQVAYTSMLARFADAAVLVIEHGSDLNLLEETVERLRLVGTPILGYIYSKAPLKPSQFRAREPAVEDMTDQTANPPVAASGGGP